jgi:hypothetical protein
MSLRREQLINIMDSATVNVAMMPPAMRPPNLKDMKLEPRLWEELRLRLQQIYRDATGENQAVLTIENGAS